MKLYQQLIDTPLGQLTAISSQDKLLELHFSQPKPHTDLVSSTTPLLDKLGEELNCYFKHENKGFSTSYLLAGTDFQVSVWEALAKVGYGSTASYSEVARMIGRPNGVRAVANAIAANPLAIIVPCHRIIHKNGDLKGYSAGTWRKLRLLELEKNG